MLNFFAVKVFLSRFLDQSNLSVGQDFLTTLAVTLLESVVAISLGLVYFKKIKKTTGKTEE